MVLHDSGVLSALRGPVLSFGLRASMRRSLLGNHPSTPPTPGMARAENRAKCATIRATGVRLQSPRRSIAGFSRERSRSYHEQRQSECRAWGGRASVIYGIAQDCMCPL